MKHDAPSIPEARVRIITATQALLATKSAQFFKVRDVAKLAGVSPALVMRYYKSKDELVFAAILASWRDAGTSLAADILAANPHVSAQDLTAALFRQDLSHGHATRDLLSMQWWWSSVEEQQYQATIQPRLDRHRRMLLQQHGLPETTRNADLEALLHVMTLLYLDCLRRACVMSRNPDDAIAEMRAMAAPLHAAFAKCAQGLLNPESEAGSPNLEQDHR